MNEEASVLKGLSATVKSAIKNDDFMKAYLAAQKEVTHATRDGENPHFGSQYSTLQSVIDTAKAALNPQGLIFHQVVIPTNANSVCVETLIIGFGETLSGGPVVVPVAKVDPQGFGSSLTYCRRYSLSCALGIFQKDNDAEEQYKRTPNVKRTPNANHSAKANY